MNIQFKDFKKYLSKFFLKKKKKIPFSYFKYFDKNEKITCLETHKNNVHLFYLHKSEVFRKFSTTREGIKKIDSENEGLTWYCNRTKNNKKSVIKKYYKEKNYAFIDIIKIKGKMIKPWGSLEKNFDFINQVINHYKKIFYKKKYSKIHGDLTLANILFYKNKIFLIDWEFYGANKKIWGYDIVYLVLSSISLPYLAKKNYSIKDTDKKLFIILWKKLIDMNINKKLIYNPFDYFKKELSQDKFLNSNSRLSKRKFFPLYTPKIFQKKIKNMIGSLK